MAPILKELETSATAASTPSSSAAPQTKSPNETATRPQPVALEIPVTVNGARTVEGSDKRAPFSEATQTVLVFPHGAVIRIATPLVPGQLVFLTNEKTKKEVVCQVVKSKSSGGAGAYVELQFTEPSIAFWGLQIPGASAAPPAPRPVAPTPAASKPVVPAPPVAVKPALPSKPVAPAALPAVPAAPIAPPPAAPANVAPVTASHQILGPEAPKLPASETPKVSGLPEKPVAVVSPADIAPPAPVHPPAPLRDYGKQIDAIFAVPQVPPAPPSSPVVAPSSPTTEDLKVQAARLQEQLNSLVFSGKPSTPVASPPAPRMPYTPEQAANELSAKLADIIQGGPAAATVPSESPSVIPIRKPATASLGADEEVKIPSWLAPISQHAEGVIESSDSVEGSVHHAASTSSEAANALGAESASHPEGAVLGGQLLGESSSATETTGGSKKGLFIGLAAAGILVLGGGAWYYHQNQSSSATIAATHSTSAVAPSEPAPVPSSPTSAVSSTPISSAGNSAPATPSKPLVAPNSAISSQISAPAVVAPSKNPKPAVNNEEEVPAPAKPSLGDVRLAAPVVNRNTDTPTDSEAFANIDTKTTPSGADPLASAAAHRNGPSAPLPVGGDVKPAQLVKSVAPAYPAIAKVQHLSGKVQIDATVDTSGNVTSVTVISGPALLHRAALDAVKQWKYSPAVLDGQPTSTHVTVTVDFRSQ